MQWVVGVTRPKCLLDPKVRDNYIAVKILWKKPRFKFKVMERSSSMSADLYSNPINGLGIKNYTKLTLICQNLSSRSKVMYKSFSTSADSFGLHPYQLFCTWHSCITDIQLLPEQQFEETWFVASCLVETSWMLKKYWVLEKVDIYIITFLNFTILCNS